jgi:hypothetical protein
LNQEWQLNRRQFKNFVQEKWMEKLKIKTLSVDGGFHQGNKVKIPLMDKKKNNITTHLQV